MHPQCSSQGRALSRCPTTICQVAGLLYARNTGMWHDTGVSESVVFSVKRSSKWSIRQSYSARKLDAMIDGGVKEIAVIRLLACLKPVSVGESDMASSCFFDSVWYWSCVQLGVRGDSIALIFPIWRKRRFR